GRTTPPGARPGFRRPMATDRSVAFRTPRLLPRQAAACGTKLRSPHDTARHLQRIHRSACDGAARPAAHIRWFWRLHRNLRRARPPARGDPMPGLTRLVLRHRLIVAVFWLAAAAAGYATISHTTARLSANFSLPGEPGYETDAGSWRYITMAVPPHPPWGP